MQIYYWELFHVSNLLQSFYISEKEIIAKGITCDCGWLINGSHKWSASSHLHAFLD